jgi:hypothetical protein
MAAAGDMTGFAATAAAPNAERSRRGRARDTCGAAHGRLTRRSAANAFGSRGVPLDAATKTGNAFVRGIQKVTGESILGAPTIARARASQAEALQRVGGDIADTVHPSPVSPEGAGAGVSESVRQVMSDLHAQANEAYGRFRKAEQGATPDMVPARDSMEPMKLDEPLGRQIALKPIYDRLARENQVVPLQFRKRMRSARSIAC